MSQERPHPEGAGKRGIGSGETPSAASTRLQAIRIALSHDLTRAGRVLERRGMIVATEGNLSARLTPERFLISRRGRRKGELKSRDYVEVSVLDSPETPVPLNASSEYRVHRATSIRPSQTDSPSSSIVSRRHTAAGTWSVVTVAMPSARAASR